jgi:di/tricarboxylate transporter
MTVEIAFVLLVLAGMCVLFAIEQLRMDVTGFLGLTALLLGGVLTVPEALAGFSDPTVHMIAGLFVVGAGIFRTGLADRIAGRLARTTDGSRVRLLVTVMLVAAVLSAFLSSTGTIAVMIPVVTTLARRSQTSPSQLMIPLAFAALLGGLLTLVGTPPNIVVSNALRAAGHAPFGFFDFTGTGLCLLALGIGYLALLGGKLLPDRIVTGSAALPSARELWERYGLTEHVFELEVAADSPLVGRTIAESAIRTRFGVGVFAVGRPGEPQPQIEGARADRMLQAFDRLTVKGKPEAAARFCAEMRLRERDRPARLPAGLVVAELLVPPGSAFTGKSVSQAQLRTRFDVTVMAVFRSTAVMQESVASTVLSVGDVLLVLGPGKALWRLRDQRSDAILVTETEELRRADFREDRAPHALLILLGMLVLMALELTPPVLAVICAALAMVLAGCLDLRSAEQAVSWESVLLIATVLPMATALTKTGAVALIVDGLVRSLGGAGPYVVLSALFALTTAVGLVVSNTATAVLVAPIALEVSTGLGLLPQAALMTVAVASSAAFLTPVSSPVNMLVMNAGGYRFGDFARVGAPLLLLTWLATLLVVPWFFPLRPG